MNAAELDIRRLAWACFGFAAGIASAEFLPEGSLKYVIPALICLCIVCAIISDRLGRMRALLFAALFVIGSVYSIAYSRVNTEPVLVLDGETVTARAKALDATRSRGDYTLLDAKFTLDDGQSFTARIYDFDGNLSPVQPGDILSGEFRLRRGDVMYGEEYSGYLSRGVTMLAYPTGDVAVTENLDLLSMPRRLACRIENLVDELFADDVRVFEKALLTGEKTELYNDHSLSRSLSHSGLSHVVAVSGLHVSFVVGVIMLLCGARRAFLLGVPAVIIFMMMTGMTPSVVRAGILYLALLSAPMVRRESDGMTTLLFALAVILLFNPAAVHSISLQLSFSAMAGILLFTQPMSKAMYEPMRLRVKNRRLHHALWAAIGCVTLTLGASILSMPFVVYHFGYIPIYSLLSNLLTYFVVSVIFCGGYVACALGTVLPVLGRALAWMLAWGVRYVQFCAGMISSLPGCVVYTENPIFLGWLAFAYALFIIAWLMRGKRAFRPVFPAGLAVISLCLCCIFVNLEAPKLRSGVTVLDVGQGQSIVMLAGGRSVVIDCGSGGTFDGAGETTARYLLSRGIKHLDALILTHLHSDHAGGAAELMELMEVDRIIMGKALSDDDGLLEDILLTADRQGTELCYIEEDMNLTAGDIDLDIIAPLVSGDANESGLIINGGIGAFDVLITGDVGTSVERELIETKNLRDTELYILGHHGGKDSTSLKLMERIRPEYAAVSVGYNSYGHPTTEAIERAIGFGAKLYRTDLNGNICFYTGEDHG